MLCRLFLPAPSLVETARETICMLLFDCEIKLPTALLSKVTVALLRAALMAKWV